MFSRLSWEFGGPFLCVGSFFVLWDFVHSVGPFVRWLSYNLYSFWVLCFGLIECSGFAGFWGDRAIPPFESLFFWGVWVVWRRDFSMSGRWCFMPRDQSYACSCFLWIAIDSLDLWPGSTPLDYFSWHLDFVYFLVPSPFFNGLWAILWAFLWESKSGAFPPNLCTFWDRTRPRLHVYML